MTTTIERGQRKLSGVVYGTVAVCIVCVLVIAVAVVSYFTLRFVLEEKGQARIQVLEQISDVCVGHRHSMENAMDLIYDTLYPLLTQEPLDETVIQRELDETQALLDSVGIEVTMDVIINARQVYMTDNETDESIRSLLNSYWYIKHYSGETETSWNLRFIDVGDLGSYFLSYGRTVYDEQGRAVAVIVINTSQDVQFRALQRLVDESDRVYILDKNGIVICHSNPQLIGTWRTSIAAFEQRYGYGSSKIARLSGQLYMVSNYHDEESGWVFVEEQNMSGLLASVAHVLAACLMTVVLTGALAMLFAYGRVQRAMADLKALTLCISSLQPEHLQTFPVQTRYQEVSVLGASFNHMITQIQALIQDVQRREAERLSTEYDFLQSQLSQHFMHNTLTAIKSLLAMGKIDQASRMMSQFVELVYIPSSSEIPLVTLGEECHLLANYVSIMNCRTDKQVAFVQQIPERLTDVLVPRMILQPIVGNAFFHGFADRETDCEIRITAAAEDGVLTLTVWDNGEGIAPERLAQVAAGQYVSVGRHHGVGIQNVKKRLGIVYGGSSGVEIASEYGRYTQVTLRIDGYEHPLMSLVGQRLLNASTGRRAPNEDTGG